MKYLVWSLLALALVASAARSIQAGNIRLSRLGTYETGVFDDAAAEIPAYDPITQRLFVVNGAAGIDVLNFSNPNSPTLEFTIDNFTNGNGTGATSVSVFNGVVAVSVQEPNKVVPGVVNFYATNLNNGDAALASAAAGSLPDMLTFTPNGAKVLVANEGEPNSQADDPEGSVTLIDVSQPGGAHTLQVDNVQHAGFTAFNGLLDPNATPAAGVRINANAQSVAQDLEPEYIAVDAASATAYVALQENNAFAVLDIASATITDVLPLGVKDHSLAGAGLDANRNDDAINIATAPVFGMFMPDAIAAFEVGGQTYLITANEGDARDPGDYGDFASGGLGDEIRLEDVTLDPAAFAAFPTLQDDDTNIGDLHISEIDGDLDNDGDLDEIYAYGARSFSIFDSSGNLVFDSGDSFEQTIAALLPADFNSNNDENQSLDSRSDDKGPEPEGVTIGNIGGKPYAFIGLERVGGVMVYDVSNPLSPVFQQYINPRDFGPSDPLLAGDLGPEGLIFISAADSPTGVPLLVVANEVSGSTTAYAITAVPEPTTLGLLTLGLGLLATRRRNRHRSTISFA